MVRRATAVDWQAQLDEPAWLCAPMRCSRGALTMQAAPSHWQRIVIDIQPMCCACRAFAWFERLSKRMCECALHLVPPLAMLIHRT